ncbi:hypothetical protein FB45DRAFT_892010 [Roridomyces roridus]|uniref:Uncharacterized protein n=1 Tax=Roridomyces roridus TaxID=1738132 RepID=A0AAD7CEI5_9AGAR|nr:hypothetical protein FB45DRAFT_892010 [Roridomyces roridus]
MQDETRPHHSTLRRVVPHAKILTSVPFIIGTAAARHFVHDIALLVMVDAVLFLVALGTMAVTALADSQIAPVWIEPVGMIALFFALTTPDPGFSLSIIAGLKTFASVVIVLVWNDVVTSIGLKHRRWCRWSLGDLFKPMSSWLRVPGTDPGNEVKGDEGRKEEASKGGPTPRISDGKADSVSLN